MPERRSQAIGRASEDAVPGAARCWHLDNTPLFLWMDVLARVWSPYQTNPCNYNPLRALLRARDHQPHRRDQLQLGAAIAFIEQIMGPSAAADPVKRMFLHIIN